MAAHESTDEVTIFRRDIMWRIVWIALIWVAPVFNESDSGFQMDPVYGVLDEESKSLPRLDLSNEKADKARLNWGDLPEEFKAAATAGDVDFLSDQLKSPDLQTRWYAAYALGSIKRNHDRARIAVEEYFAAIPPLPRTTFGTDGFMHRIVDGEIKRSRNAMAERSRKTLLIACGSAALVFFSGWLLFDLIKKRAAGPA